MIPHSKSAKYGFAKFNDKNGSLSVSPIASQMWNEID